MSPLLLSVFVNSANRALQRSNRLAFADDMKLFLRENALNVCLKLQSLNHLISRSNTNLDCLLIFPNVVLYMIFTHHIETLSVIVTTRD